MKGSVLPRVERVILTALGLACVIAVVQLAARAILLDFRIYHEASQRLLAGASPYDFYGPARLPFQYVPWALWLFAPLGALPLHYAWVIFVGLNLLLLAVVFLLLLRLHHSRLTKPQALSLYGISLLIGLLLFFVGQASVLQLTAGVLMMVFISRGRPVMAGMWFPLLCIKPHLVLIAIPALWWAGGRKAVISSVVSTAALLVVSELLTPSWVQHVLGVVTTLHLRNDRLVWNFSTLAGLLSLERRWNLIFAATLVPPGALLVYRLRRLPTAAWLSVAFAVSLMVTPHAFAYDLVMLLPAMIWLTDRWALRSVWLWLAAVLVVGASNYSSGTYLVTVAVVVAAVWRARALLKGQRGLATDHSIGS